MLGWVSEIKAFPQTNTQTDIQIDIHTYVLTKNRYIDRQAGRLTGRHADRQTGRQADR
jgi:hypothetical protein